MPTPQCLTRLRDVTLAMCLTVVVAGCQSGSGSPRRGLFDQVDNAAITQQELQARVSQFVYRTELLVQQAGGGLYIEARDSRTRAAAARFVLQTNDEISRATFQGDPLATLVDTWALCMQLEQWFGAHGFIAFKEHQDDLAKIFGSLAVEAKGIAADINGADQAEAFAQIIGDWVKANPVQLDMTRPSVAPLLATVGVEDSRGLGAISETVGQGLNDLSERIEIMQTQLPRILVWQAALMLEVRIASMNLSIDDLVDDVGAKIEPAVTAQVDRLIAPIREEIASLRAFVTEERMAIMANVGVERAAVMASVDEQRIALQDAIEVMRVRSFADIERERDMILQSVQAITNNSLDAVDVQRVATVRDLDGIVNAMLVDVDAQRQLAANDINLIVQTAVDETVDRVFWLVVKLGAAAFGGLFLLAAFVRLLWRSK